MRDSRAQLDEGSKDSTSERVVGTRRAPNSLSTGEIPVVSGPLGHRAAKRARSRSRFAGKRNLGRPFTAVAAMAAFAVAGFGAVTSATSIDSGVVAASFTEINRDYVDLDGNGTNAKDISRDYDRALAKQAPQQAEQIKQALAELNEETASASEEYGIKIARQWVLPVTGYRLSARFGQTSSRWSRGVHTGLDFAGYTGMPIVSVAAGTVVSSGWEGAYGLATVIALEDGTRIKYAHQSKTLVSPGQQVKPGQMIGHVGSTGNSTGPHLHLEVITPGGIMVDPYTALLQHNVRP